MIAFSFKFLSRTLTHEKGFNLVEGFVLRFRDKNNKYYGSNECTTRVKEEGPVLGDGFSEG